MWQTDWAKSIRLQSGRVGFGLTHNEKKKKNENVYLPHSKFCNKLFDMKCINFDSPMSRKSSDQQINTCSLIIKSYKSKYY